MSLPKRSEIPVEDCWDIESLYQTPQEWEKEIPEIVKAVDAFVEKYRGKLAVSNDVNYILQAVNDYNSLMDKAMHNLAYPSLLPAVDRTNMDAVSCGMKAHSIGAELRAKLSFYQSELSQVSDEILAKAKKDKEFGPYIAHMIREKEFLLSPETEKVLAALGGSVMELPMEVYETSKLADMDFGSFEIDGKEYPLSYTLYETTYCSEKDTAVRRAAFDAFSKVLRKYRNTVATLYNAQVQKEVTLAKLRGHKSVFEYLLLSQQVTEELYNRQIDNIMRDLAPHMRRYAAKIKSIYNLDRLTWADLKLMPMEDGEPKVAKEEAWKMVEEAVSVMGDEYRKLVMRGKAERWVDFARNIGKSTGGFCYVPSNSQPFILLNWSGNLSEAYTLVHELGHAAQGLISMAHNKTLVSDPTMYFVEAPSTFHELLLTQSLSKTEKYRKAAATLMVGNTYYHNCVTHLLEAAYQREVYRRAWAGENLTADDFDQITRDVFTEFWGEEVELIAGCELTWMRQPHYYMGLYPYTYSAGLTVATAVARKIADGDPEAVPAWLNTLKAGGTVTPVELAQIAGVDITTDKPLKDTIAYIGELIDTI